VHAFKHVHVSFDVQCVVFCAQHTHQQALLPAGVTVMQLVLLSSCLSMYQSMHVRQLHPTLGLQEWVSSDGQPGHLARVWGEGGEGVLLLRHVSVCLCQACSVVMPSGTTRCCRNVAFFGNQQSHGMVC
jgi:hypothetical protein